MSQTSLSEELQVVPETAHSPDDRMPMQRQDELTQAQKTAIEFFEQQRGRKVAGPFVALLRSPRILKIATEMGAYLRYETGLPLRLTEMAILITARRWSQNYEWIVHRQVAEKAGLGRNIIDALRDGRRPKDMSDDEEALYDFCMELYCNGQISDPTYFQMKEKFGEKGIIDFSSICGYYSLLGMVMNTAGTPLPIGADKELEGFPG